jgi:uncharacterized membrane protein
MNKMLVAVFDNENKAFEGLTALKGLHRKGDISLYATAVISKDEKGELLVKTASDEGPVGTATGFFTGSLLGLLGGPIGLAIGAVTGTVAGVIFDLNADDIDTTFAEEVSVALANGSTAVVAEIDEEWTVPVDAQLEPLDALVFRRLRYEVAEDQLARESKAIAAEFKRLQKELKEAGEEDKASIKAAIARLQTKAWTTSQLVKSKMDASKRQLDAKVATMEQQMKEAKDRRKAKIEERIYELKEEYSIRTEKLQKASRLIGEAIAPKKEPREVAQSAASY